MSRVQCTQRVWPHTFFVFVKQKNKNKKIVAIHYMARRAVVSRVIRVQRRYAVQIRPMESMAWTHFVQIFELFIELYRICTHFSYIEYVLRIHLVKIS